MKIGLLGIVACLALTVMAAPSFAAGTTRHHHRVHRSHHRKSTVHSWVKHGSKNVNHWMNGTSKSINHNLSGH